MTTPSKFGRYELLERIAQGGMAEVFLARSGGASGFEKELVIKRILPEFSRDQQFVKMFVDEAQIAAQLHHPNIVQVFDFDQVENTYFIAMEYVEGVDLRSVLEKASLAGDRLELGECLYVVKEVAKALDYAHRRKVHGRPLNIIHRDISPHNVLLSFDGTVKLTDFGIAKAASRVSRTQDGVVKGKVAYMSPEQARGQPLDARSDLFALGTVFFELVTMRRLFYSDSDREILRKVMAADVPSPRSYNRKLPTEVERIIMKLLVRPLEKRFGSAAEFLRELSPVYHRLVDGSPELDIRQRLKALFPDRRRHSAPDENPGSWPPQSDWPGRAGTPVLQSPPPEAGTPPPVPTELVRREMLPKSPPARSPAAGTPYLSDENEQTDPIEKLLAQSPQVQTWDDADSDHGYDPLDDEDTQPVFAVGEPAQEPKVRQRRRQRRGWLRGSRRTPRQKIVKADPGEMSPGLFEKETVLYSNEEPAETAPFSAAPSRSRRRSARTLIAAGSFVLAGLVVGILFALLRSDPETPPASEQSEVAVEDDTTQNREALTGGTVVIRTVPTGASVTVDGFEIPGQTPLSLSLPLNQETALIIEMEDYHTEEVTVTVSNPSRPTEQLVRLRPLDP